MTATSTQRRYMGLVLFQKLAERLAAWELPTIFTRSVLRLLMDSAGNAKMPLHEIAKQTVLLRAVLYRDSITY